MVTLGTAGSPRRNAADWFEAIAASPRPAVVDYGTDTGRVELSGRVVANWAAKTANLLEAEGLEAGIEAVVDARPGWQALAVLLGLARAGVGLRFETAGTAGTQTAADLVITDSPAAWASAPAELWAIEAAGEPEDRPAHAVDFAAEVRLQADRCVLPLPTGDLSSIAAGWTGAGTGPDEDGHDAGPRWVRRERGLEVAAHIGRLDRALTGAIAWAWAAGLPVVLVPASRADDDGSAPIVAAERLGDPVPER